MTLNSAPYPYGIWTVTLMYQDIYLDLCEMAHWQGWIYIEAEEDESLIQDTLPFPERKDCPRMRTRKMGYPRWRKS
jgi:hypothetical protein